MFFGVRLNIICSCCLSAYHSHISMMTVSKNLSLHLAAQEAMGKDRNAHPLILEFLYAPPDALHRKNINFALRTLKRRQGQ